MDLHLLVIASRGKLCSSLDSGWGPQSVAWLQNTCISFNWHLFPNYKGTERLYCSLWPHHIFKRNVCFIFLSSHKDSTASLLSLWALIQRGGVCASQRCMHINTDSSRSHSRPSKVHICVTLTRSQGSPCPSHIDNHYAWYMVLNRFSKYRTKVSVWGAGSW